MKKLIIIIVLTIISFLSIGSYILYKGYLKAYKADFRTYINLHQQHLPLVKHIIQKSELYVNTKLIQWEDEDKEVVINGKLYDVISSTIIKNTVELSLLEDTNEQGIKKEFASSFDLTNSKSNNPIKLLKQFLALKCVVNHSQNLNTPMSFLNTISCYSNGFSIPKIVLLVQTPPPNFIS